MEPFENPKLYDGKKTERCLGCGAACVKSPWGKWCYECNIARMKRIDKALAPVAKALGVKL